MSLYVYPQIMYRSDGMSMVCNSDSDVANLPVVAGSSWAPTPWSPASFDSGTAQADYISVVNANAILQAQVTSLQSQLASAQQTLNSMGI